MSLDRETVKKLLDMKRELQKRYEAHAGEHTSLEEIKEMWKRWEKVDTVRDFHEFKAWVDDINRTLRRSDQLEKADKFWSEYLFEITETPKYTKLSNMVRLGFIEEQLPDITIQMRETKEKIKRIREEAETARKKYVSPIEEKTKPLVAEFGRLMSKRAELLREREEIRRKLK